MQDLGLNSQNEEIVASLSAEVSLSFLLTNTKESFIFLDHNLSIWLFNDKARYFYLNHLGVKLAVGSQFLDYVPIQGKEIIKDRCVRVLSGLEEEWESKVIFLDGTTKELISKFKPAVDESGAIAGIKHHLQFIYKVYIFIYNPNRSSWKIPE